MGRTVGRIWGFSEFSGLSPDSGLWIRTIIHSLHLMLLNAWVSVLELTRAPISQHLGSHVGRVFVGFSDFLISQVCVQIAVDTV